MDKVSELHIKYMMKKMNNGGGNFVDVWYLSFLRFKLRLSLNDVMSFEGSNIRVWKS